MTNMVKAELVWKVGDDHSAVIQTTVPEGTEVVYFTAGFAGWSGGMAASSDFLVDLLPDDAEPDLKIRAVSSKVSKALSS